MKPRNIAIAVVGAVALAGTLYFHEFGWLVVLMLLVPVLMCGLAVWFPGAYPNYDMTEDTVQRDALRKRALKLSLSLGGLSTLFFALLTWSYLSWPNRGAMGALLQALLLMSMIYQYQYLGFAWRGKRLPGKVWPMRIIAITMGGMFGAILVVVQVEYAEHWLRNRQKPFLAQLDAAEDRCATFKQYLLDHPPSSKFETPDLYHGTVGAMYGGQSQYVLAFNARSDGDGMIVFYHSIWHKWITTKRDNQDGMRMIKDAIRPLERCEGSGEPVVRIDRRGTGDRPDITSDKGY